MAENGGPLLGVWPYFGALESLHNIGTSPYSFSDISFDFHDTNILDIHYQT